MRVNNIQQYLTYYILLFSSVWIFFCFNESSMAVECIILFVLLLLLNPRSDNFRDIVFFLIITVFFSLALLLSGRFMERGDYNIPWKFLVKFFHLLFASMCGSVINNLDSNKKRKIVLFSFVSITFSSAISLYYVLRVNSLAIRYRQLVGITQTVSFDQLFALPILAPILALFIWKYKNDIKHKYLFFISTALVFFCVFFSVLTTAILICLIGLIFVFLFISFEKKNKVSIVLALILLLSFIILLFFRSQIGEILYGITGNMSNVVQQRLSRVIDMLFATEHDNAYSMDRRFELANYSLDTFKSNPIFGIGIGEIRYGVIGYHQEWPDVLGVCGLVGFTILAVAFYDFFVRLLNRTTNKVDKVGTIIGIFLMIILGCLDPCLVIPELYLVMVILPNLSSILSKEVQG